MSEQRLRYALEQQIAAAELKFELACKTLGGEIERYRNGRDAAIAERDAALLRLGTCVEALECLLPGLTLDLRYADPDDDRDAMRSRIKTVTDALQASVVEKGASNG